MLLDHELGTIRKSHTGKLKIALIYPNTYAVGMSNLAIHTLYREFNARDEIVCERVFYEPDSTNVPQSLESGMKLTGFDILACSLSFELDYLNLLRLMYQANIPMLREERNQNHPLVIAGGIAVSANPEPLADIVDAVVLGEAEEIIEPLLDILVASSRDKKNGLQQLAQLSGIYVPELFDSADTLPRLQVKDLNKYPTVSQVITPDAEFKNMFLIELGRGCPYGCKFCLAGKFYSPVRFRSLEHIYQQISDCGLRIADFKRYRVGLVATALADYPKLEDLCDELLRKKVAVSSASLRADKAPDILLELLHRSGQKTITFAPEAGSDRLRSDIGKPLSDLELASMVERSVNAGMMSIKLYFMIGLPTETEEDIAALISLSKQLRNTLLTASKPFGRVGRLIISISPFVPKKGTFFEHQNFAPLPELKQTLRDIRNRLKKEPNIQLQITNPKIAQLEATISLGSRDLSRQLITLASLSR